MTKMVWAAWIAAIAMAFGVACDRGGDSAGSGSSETTQQGVVQGSGEQEPAEAHAGQVPYERLCASCHGEDGTPTGAGRAVGAASLRTSRVHNLPEADIATLVREGRGNMRPITVDDATLADIIAYLRTISAE